MTKTCTHTAVFYTKDDVALNSARQAEQKDIRKPGEVFVLNIVSHCRQCGEVVLKPIKLRRKHEAPV